MASPPATSPLATSPLATAPPATHAPPPGETDPPVGLDLARWLIPAPQRSLLLRVHGDSMQGAGIHHGDLLVVERDRPALPGAIVVARLGDRFTLKRLRCREGRRWLEAAHPAYGAIDLEDCGRREGLTGSDVQLWGVALHVIRSC